MSELKLCPWCGQLPTWHIGGASDDILFFGCGGHSRCVSWSYAFTKPDFETVLLMAKRRWNQRFEPPAKSLTFEQLRGMDGQPVWVEWACPEKTDLIKKEWALVRISKQAARGDLLQYSFDGYGKTWLAYTKKPDGETVCD
jgi:hypothetical protein